MSIGEWGGGARPFFAPCNKKGRPVERPSLGGRQAAPQGHRRPDAQADGERVTIGDWRLVIADSRIVDWGLLVDGLPIAEWGGRTRPFFSPCNKEGRPVERPSL